MRNVVITGTDFLPPHYRKVPELMKKLIRNVNVKMKGEHPLLRAADLHVEFESIHPFIDGNGRIGRLLLSIATMKNGFSPVIIPPIRRSEYITALQKTDRGDINAMRAFLSSAIYEEMKSLSKIVETLIK